MFLNFYKQYEKYSTFSILTLVWKQLSEKKFIIFFTRNTYIFLNLKQRLWLPLFKKIKIIKSKIGKNCEFFHACDFNVNNFYK